MKVDVYTPEDCVGDVIGDLNRRRGMIKSQDTVQTGTRVNVQPLAEMFCLSFENNDVWTRSVFYGIFSLLPCPSNVAEEIIKETLERKINNLVRYILLSPALRYLFLIVTLTLK